MSDSIASQQFKLVRGPSRRNSLSRIISATMYALCILAAVGILTVLGLVIGYLVSIGASSLSFTFFTQTPIPPAWRVIRAA